MMNIGTRKFTLLVLILLMILSSFGMVQAQNALTYGTGVVARLDATTPQGFFNFTGTTGDLVTISLIGLSPQLNPTLSLLSPTGEQLGFSTDNPFTPMANDAQITARLTQDGLYNVFVGTADNSAGDYALIVNRAEPVISTALQAGEVVQINIPPGAPSQVYGLATSPSVPVDLVIESNTPDFAVSVIIRNADGAVGAVVTGTRLVYTIPPGGGLYEVTVSSADPATQGTVTISTGAAATTGQAAAPVATEEAPIAPAGTDPLANMGPGDVCAVTPVNNANLRTGPGTNYDVGGQLISGAVANPSGQASGSDGFIWYQLPNSLWVRSDVVRQAGACVNVPIASTPAPPAQPTSPPPAATEEPGATVEATATEEVDATQEPTATEETQAQVAPPDTEQYILDVDRDASVQFSEVISSPQGDHTDLIWVNITGLSNQPPNSFREFSITLVCNGTGTEFVNWGTGQTGLKTCGQSLNQSFTNDSDTVLLNVRLPEGSGEAFVNYTFVINKIG